MEPKGITVQNNGQGNERRRSLVSDMWSAITRHPDKLLALVTLITSLVLGGFYLREELDRRMRAYIEERISPYENLLTGLALIQNKEYDASIKYLREALENIDEKNASINRVRAIVDNYIHAIAYSRNAAVYSPDIHKLKEYIGPKVPKVGFHWEQLGWIELYTSAFDAAKISFETAVSEYGKERLYRKIADAAWGLALLRICKGDTAGAVRYTIQAAENNRGEYDLTKMFMEAERWRNEYDIDQLSNSCGRKDFDANFQIFMNEIFKNAIRETEQILVKAGFKLVKTSAQ